MSLVLVADKGGKLAGGVSLGYRVMANSIGNYTAKVGVDQPVFLSGRCELFAKKPFPFHLGEGGRLALNKELCQFE